MSDLKKEMEIKGIDRVHVNSEQPLTFRSLEYNTYVSMQSERSTPELNPLPTSQMVDIVVI